MSTSRTSLQRVNKCMYLKQELMQKFLRSEGFPKLSMESTERTNVEKELKKYVTDAQIYTVDSWIVYNFVRCG